MRAGKGDDTVLSSRGKDVLSGGKGGDRLLGGRGYDLIFGGPGRDSYSGGRGQDCLATKDGLRELVRGGSGKDTAAPDRLDVLRGVERKYKACAVPAHPPT